jgi:hypothetical protein
MIYPYAAALHGIMALLCLASLAYLHFRRQESVANAGVEAYYNWFFLYFLYNFLLVLPLFLFDELNKFTAIFYASALVFLGIAAWQAFRSSLHFSANPHAKLLSTLYIIGVTIASLLHFAFFEIPVGSPDGNWVFWYSNQPLSLFFTFFMFVAGWHFSWQFLKGMARLEGLIKLRSIFLALGSFTLPFAAFYYFGAESLMHIYLAFAAAISGLVFLAIGNVILGILHKKSRT